MMRNQLTPILIGFPLDKHVNQEVVRVNQTLGSSQIDFNSVIPHVTLWMGFVKTKQIEALNLGLDKIFQNVSIEVQLEKMERYDSKFGLVWSIGINLSRELYLLQNRIHHFFEPFREKATEYNGLSRETIEYINDFSSKSLDHYSPHITIGFGGENVEFHTASKIILKDPKMFKVGNYCTCTKQIQ